MDLAALPEYAITSSPLSGVLGKGGGWSWGFCPASKATLGIISVLI